MEPIHIFHKELPLDENNIFMANLTEKNEVEEVKFKKLRNIPLQAYLLTKMLIQIWLR